MSIPSNQLELGIKNTVLTMTQGKLTIRSTYQAIAPSYSVAVAETLFAQSVARFDEFEERDSLSWKKAQNWFAVVCEWHAARGALGGYSQHDADLVLSNWAIVSDGVGWKMAHAVCGTFTGVTLPFDESGRPTLVGRVAAIIARVLPPPTWGFAESDSGETLTVRCIQVQGATSYNVYHDVGDGQFVLLGNVPDHEPHTLNVAAGYYRVRMAGVVGGVVGVMSNATEMQVAAAAQGGALASVKKVLALVGGKR